MHHRMKSLTAFYNSSKCSQEVICIIKTIKLWRHNKCLYLRANVRHGFRKNGGCENLCLHFLISVAHQKDLSNHKSPRSFKILILKLNLYSITSLLCQRRTKAILAVVEFWKCMVCFEYYFNMWRFVAWIMGGGAIKNGDSFFAEGTFDTSLRPLAHHNFFLE